MYRVPARRDALLSNRRRRLAALISPVRGSDANLIEQKLSAGQPDLICKPDDRASWDAHPDDHIWGRMIVARTPCSSSFSLSDSYMPAKTHYLCLRQLDYSNSTLLKLQFMA